MEGGGGICRRRERQIGPVEQNPGSGRAYLVGTRFQHAHFARSAHANGGHIAVRIGTKAEILARAGTGLPRKTARPPLDDSVPATCRKRPRKHLASRSRSARILHTSRNAKCGQNSAKCTIGSRRARRNKRLRARFRPCSFQETPPTRPADLLRGPQSCISPSFVHHLKKRLYNTHAKTALRERSCRRAVLLKTLDWPRKKNWGSAPETAAQTQMQVQARKRAQHRSRNETLARELAGRDIQACHPQTRRAFPPAAFRLSCSRGRNMSPALSCTDDLPTWASACRIRTHLRFCAPRVGACWKRAPTFRLRRFRRA